MRPLDVRLKRGRRVDESRRVYADRVAPNVVLQEETDLLSVKSQAEAWNLRGVSVGSGLQAGTLNRGCLC